MSLDQWLRPEFLVVRCTYTTHTLTLRHTKSHFFFFETRLTRGMKLYTKHKQGMLSPELGPCWLYIVHGRGGIVQDSSLQLQHRHHSVRPNQRVMSSPTSTGSDLSSPTSY